MDMPRKRVRTPPSERSKSDIDDEDFFLDDSQSLSGRSGGGDPPQRNAANARERARMRVLSKAFCRLKTTLPWVPADTKLSKLDTLRLASSYIAHLRTILQQEPTSHATCPHPLNLAWPFAFQHGGSIAAAPRSNWPGTALTSTADPQGTFQRNLDPRQQECEATDSNFNSLGYECNTSCRDDYYFRNINYAVNNSN